MSLGCNISNTNSSGFTLSSTGPQIFLQQSGYAYGTSLSVANRPGQNGVLISTASTATTVTDLVMRSGAANSSRNIQLESRTDFCKTGQHSLQIGVAGSASLSVGDKEANANRLYIGAQPTASVTPTDLLTVHGTVAAPGAITSNGNTVLTTTITPSSAAVSLIRMELKTIP